MFIAFICVFLVAIIIISVIAKSTGLSPDNNGNVPNNNNSDNSVYKNYEVNVEDAARIYYNNNSDVLSDGESVIISISKLSINSKITNNCTGYVRLTDRSGTVAYAPYLSCGAYKTSGYVEEFDN